MWIDPKLLKVVTPYKFQKPPTITTSGVYQFRGGKNTRLEINVDSPGGMDYVFLDKALPFDRIKAKLLLTDDRLQISGGICRVLGGGRGRNQCAWKICRGCGHCEPDVSVAQTSRIAHRMALERQDFQRG